MQKAVKRFAQVGVVLLVLNEIRGLILAGPVIYAAWQTGGDATAIWLCICALGGIALSVIVPWIVTRRIAASRAFGRQLDRR